MNIPSNYLEKFKVFTPQTLFEPDIQGDTRKGICPLCFNKLHTTQNGKLKLCLSKKHAKPFIMKIK